MRDKRLAMGWALSSMFTIAQAQAPSQGADEHALPMALLEYLAEWRDEAGALLDPAVLDLDFHESELLDVEIPGHDDE